MNIEKRMKEFSPDEKIIISGYTRMTDKCHFKCLTCGNEFDARPETIIKRHSHHICLNCFPPLREKEIQERKAIIEQFKTAITAQLLDIYVDRHLRVKFKCLKCGEINDFKWMDRKNLKCTYCEGTRHTINLNAYQYLLNEKYDNKFEVLRFESMAKRALLKCQCGFCFTILPVSTLRECGIRCPHCEKSISKAESYIENYLIKHNFSYEMQKHFDWMPSRTRYDFFIPSLNCIIEFHGEQHYKYVDHFHRSYDEWKRACGRDEIKQTEAINHNINYLIIPFQFQNCLKEILDNLFGSTTISQESRAKLLEIQDFLKKEEDIV